MTRIMRHRTTEMTLSIPTVFNINLTYRFLELLKYRLFSPNDSTLRTDNTNVK